ADRSERGTARGVRALRDRARSARQGSGGGRGGCAAALSRLSGPPLPYRYERGAARECIRTDGRKLTCPDRWEEAPNLPKAKVKARTASAGSAEIIFSSARSSAGSPPKASSRSTIKTSTC